MAFQQLSDLFEAAIAIEGESARMQFLTEKCAGNSSLFTEVCELVESHFRGNRLLDSPTHVLDLVHQATSDHETEGAVTGNFKLLQKIGEGGMGVVFMAEQLRPIRRKVAFKIIREGMNSKQIIARFEAEREALARLDHPNVTRILDAGVTESGRPFFVMELVRGTSITEYCNTNRVSIEQRLQLLEQVCLVIHHAHQKGIVHRDVKPSNVMITMHDGVPVPKVIDFGIAKALDRPLTEQTLFTRYGDLIGTPEYMSPEQAEMSGLDLDVRTDIYSLGVLLYELLTGSTPLTSAQIQGKGLLKIFETIRDCETEAPSARITRISDTASKVAEQRQSNPLQLRKMIAGELDWITMKALAKDRNERYESAAAMAKDLRRYLQGEPVEAAAPSFGYQARKFYQKHRAACTIALMCAALLLTSTTFSIYWAISSYYHRTIAENQTKELAANSQALTEAKNNAEKALDRALIAEKKAESMARNEKNKAIMSRAQTRYMGEVVVQLEKVTVNERVSSASPIEPNDANPVQISIFNQGANVIDLPLESSDGTPEMPRTTPTVIKSRENQMPASEQFAIVQSLAQDAVSRVKQIGGRGVVFSAVTREIRMHPRILELLLEEQRKEFGNHDPFVAQTLIRLTESIFDKQSSESFVLAENHLREAISILETHRSQENVSDASLALDLLEAKVMLGQSLALQKKDRQAESVLKESELWFNKLECEPSDTSIERRQRLIAISKRISHTKNTLQEPASTSPTERRKPSVVTSPGEAGGGRMEP